MKNILIILFFLLISNNTFAKGHKYSKEVCKEIYQGIGYFLKEADVLWKKRGSSNDKKALLFSQAAANYTVVYESFCKHDKGKKKRRPNQRPSLKPRTLWARAGNFLILSQIPWRKKANKN